MATGAQAAFYRTDAWRQCAEAYKRSVGGLCEKCYARGKIIPGEFVHHKIHLNNQNVHDPEVTLNWENLELLCRDCHAAEHSKRVKRYKVDALGRVQILT